MRLYISGAISSDLEGWRAKFCAAADQLREAGYEVCNVAEMEEPAEEPERTWLDYMRRDVALLADCDGVATLPDWTASRGARVEVQLANGLGLPVSCVSGWLTDAGEEPVLVE